MANVKKRRGRGRAVCKALLCIALCAGAAGAFLLLRKELAGPVAASTQSLQSPVVSVDYIDGAYRAVTLSGGVQTSLADYESEYVQFGIGESILLPPEDRVDETVVSAPVLAPLESVSFSAVQVEEGTVLQGALPEEDDTAPQEEVIEAQGQGQYAAVSVDGAIVGTLPCYEDFLWIYEHLLEGCGSSGEAEVLSRGFVEKVEPLLQEDEPAHVIDRDTLYLYLADNLTLTWTEKAQSTEKVNYSKVYIEDDALAKGKTRVVTEGKAGKARNTYAVTFVDGKEEKRELTAQKVVEAPVTEVIAKGTKAAASTTTTTTTNSVPVSGTGGYWPGTTIGKGVDYPNIDTTRSRPNSGQGIKGPSTSLNFIYPVKGAGKSSISSYFGWRYGRMHYGVDIFDNRGTKLIASESGTVTSYTGAHSGYGLIVEIKHSDGYTTRYAHCNEILVKAGDKVSKGDVIATMGATGVEVSGPHVHFEIRCDGVPYNPEFYLN